MALTTVNDTNFKSEVLDSPIPVLVDFWAEWCGPCRMLAPVLDALALKFAGQLKIVKLDTDASPGLAGQFEISAIPCCILFKNGAEVNRFTGFRPQPAFESELAPFIS